MEHLKSPYKNIGFSGYHAARGSRPHRSFVTTDGLSDRFLNKEGWGTKNNWLKGDWETRVKKMIAKHPDFNFLKILLNEIREIYETDSQL